MTIGIDASKYSVLQKTGTEYYASVLIQGIVTQAIDDGHTVILYTKERLSYSWVNNPHIEQRVISYPYLWTIVGLSLALWRDKPDVFYTPASIIPPIHPPKSIAVIHGLEYEYFPQAYSLFRFWHLVIFTWFTSHWASRIITPSQITKDDLIQEYDVPENTISVIHSGIPMQSVIKEEISQEIQALTTYPYILWIGRKESRKNIDVLIDSIVSLQIQYPSLRLILIGKEGYGYSDLRKKIQSLPPDIVIELGYVNEDEKSYLLKHASVFCFPSWYEGFGFPILEALSARVPVIASDIPIFREIAGDVVQYANPNNAQEWISKITHILEMPEEDKKLLVEEGYQHSLGYAFDDTIEKTYTILIQSNI